jgi:two-component system sensor histidine kinase EvgS
MLEFEYVAARTRMLTLLVVDDDADLRTALSAALEESGHQVRQAENGRAALAELEKAPVDLAIVDVMMPDMDGLSFFDAVRAGNLCPALPTLLLTASRLPASVLGKRTVDIAYKPITVAALLELIHKLVG